MKKLVLFSLISVLSLSLFTTGCGKTSTTSTSSADTSVSDDIKTIKERGVLKAGVKVDVPKFGYKDTKTSEIDGFEIDIAKAIAKKIFGDENKIELQGVTAKTRGPLLDNGEIDIVAATFTITEERKKSYNFSEPYFTDSVGLLVKKSAGIKSLKDLNNKTIGVAQSATSKTSIQQQAEKDGVSVKFAEFSTYPEIKAALDAGRVDCFSVDGAILNGYLDDSTEILPDRFNPQDYGIATKLSNTGLAKLIDDTIKEMKQNGEIDKIIEKWGIK